MRAASAFTPGAAGRTPSKAWKSRNSHSHFYIEPRNEVPEVDVTRLRPRKLAGNVMQTFGDLHHAETPQIQQLLRGSRRAQSHLRRDIRHHQRLSRRQGCQDFESAGVADGGSGAFERKRWRRWLRISGGCSHTDDGTKLVGSESTPEIEPRPAFLNPRMAYWTPRHAHWTLRIALWTPRIAYWTLRIAYWDHLTAHWKSRHAFWKPRHAHWIPRSAHIPVPKTLTRNRPSRAPDIGPASCHARKLEHGGSKTPRWGLNVVR